MKRNAHSIASILSVPALLTVSLAALLAFSAVPAQAALADDAWMAGLEGGWEGPDNETPLGRMPFALLFERSEDDELTALAAMSRDTWIKMRFFRGDDGEWLLEQAASLEGMGEQSSILVPAEAEGDLRRWVDPKSAEYLKVDVALDAKRLYMDVTLRGRPHAQFQLQRIDDAALPAMRRSMQEGLERSSDEVSIFELAGKGHVEGALKDARRQVAANPEDAGLQMALANALIERIQTHSSEAPMLAGELLSTLKRALELDPSRPDAYQGLIGYYLQAPPIAGGSVEKAEALAKQLVTVDAAAGEAALAQVAARRSSAN